MTIQFWIGVAVGFAILPAFMAAVFLGDMLLGKWREHVAD